MHMHTHKPVCKKRQGKAFAGLAPDVLDDLAVECKPHRHACTGYLRELSAQPAGYGCISQGIAQSQHWKRCGSGQAFKRRMPISGTVDDVRHCLSCPPMLVRNALPA